MPFKEDVDPSEICEEDNDHTPPGPGTHLSMGAATYNRAARDVKTDAAKQTQPSRSLTATAHPRILHPQAATGGAEKMDEQGSSGGAIAEGAAKGIGKEKKEGIVETKY